MKKKTAKWLKKFHFVRKKAKSEGVSRDSHEFPQKEKKVTYNESVKKDWEETLAGIFGDELSVTFRRTEKGNGMYAAISIDEEGVKQQFLVFISENNADVPVKVIPVIPSGVELFGLDIDKPFKDASRYGVQLDMINPGEVYLDTVKMKVIYDKYKVGEVWSRNDVKDYITEITEWTKQMSPLRKAAHSKKNKSRTRFGYSYGSCQRCRKIIISDRAYSSMVAEALARDPDETGGILLGVIDGETWYIVEATDPGISTFHSTVHHEMDDAYLNLVYRVQSRIYLRDLYLAGLWHRHPGTLDKFSGDDNNTNANYAEAIGNGTISIILNFVPDVHLTCYYFDDKGTGTYYKPEVRIGDKYFKGTDYLVPLVCFYAALLHRCGLASSPEMYPKIEFHPGLAERITGLSEHESRRLVEDMELVYKLQVRITQDFYHRQVALIPEEKSKELIREIESIDF